MNKSVHVISDKLICVWFHQIEGPKYHGAKQPQFVSAKQENTGFTGSVSARQHCKLCANVSGDVQIKCSLTHRTPVSFPPNFMLVWNILK